jgi:uncharacterized repeat protein (TIGR01451 family)
MLALTVVVAVADPIPGDVTQIGNVAYATGATPPVCSAPLPPNCSVIPVQAPGTITITKTVEDGTHGGTAEPGEPLTYTITLTNANGGDVSGFGVTDPLDANVVFDSATNGGVHAAGAVTWSNLTIAANGSLALVVVVHVVDPIPPGVTAIGNFAYETGGTPPDCAATPMPPSCTSIPVSPGAISIVKTVADANGNAIAEPGEALTYTIAVSNTGGGDVTNYSVTDPLDPNVAFVSADNGGAFAGGAVTWSGLAIPANGSLTLALVVTVADPIPAGVVSIGNVAYATGTTPPDCAATPVPANCASIAAPAPVGTSELVIAKSVNAASAAPGGTLVYTVAVSNVGNAAATGVVVGDPIPNGIASYAWSCAGSGGASCPNANGSGAINETIATLPAGGAVTYTVTAVLTMTPPPSITNTANVVASGGTSVCAPSGSPPPCTAQAIVTVTPGTGGSEPVPTPIDSRWMLILMAMVLGAAAMRERRRN